MLYVVLPQAIRRVIPPLLNDFIGLQKDTAIVFIIGIGEAVLAAQNYATTYTNFTGYTVAAVFFVMLLSRISVSPPNALKMPPPLLARFPVTVLPTTERDP